MNSSKIPIPKFFNPEKVAQFWRVPYQERAQQAEQWAEKYHLKPAAKDEMKTCLLLIDVQNTFCLPEFELFVGGQSGQGAVEDNVRLCEFIYGNLGKISKIIPTLDTHTTMQIFHPIFWVNESGQHPTPAATIITPEDVEKGLWRVNPAVAHEVMGGDYSALQDYAYYYVSQLTQRGKYPLTIWPYHSMLGGIGHSLVSAVEEAIFFHSIARQSQTRYELEGDNPLTENYSVLQPEVMNNEKGDAIANKNTALNQIQVGKWSFQRGNSQVG